MSHGRLRALVLAEPKADTTFADFEAEVDRLASIYPTRSRSRIWMKHLKITRPEIHRLIDGKFIDPARHSTKLSEARALARREW